MQFHHIEVSENSPEPTPGRNLPFLRHRLTQPETHGFGKELWVAPLDIFTHVRAATTSGSSASDLILASTGVVRVSKELLSASSAEKVVEWETQSGGIPRGGILFCDELAELNPAVVAFLREERGVVAIASAAAHLPHTMTTNSATTLPVVLRCKKNSLLGVGEASNTAPLLIAPLHYEHISREILPTSVISLPVQQQQKAKKLSILRDCTQKLTATSALLRGGDYSAQAPLMCPASAALSRNGAAGAAILTCDVGSHVDSPRHFIANARTISDLTPTELRAPAVIIDIRRKMPAASEEEDLSRFDVAVSLDDIREWESQHGQIPDGALVCMRSGWSSRFNDPEKYRNRVRGASDTTAMHFPGFSIEAADFLASERRIVGLGVDTLSTDVGASTTYLVHKRILGESKYNVENLDLGELPPRGFFFVTAPLLVKDAFEAPCRCVAISEE